MREGLIATMCDCEELEYEDFELMLEAISRVSRAAAEEAPGHAPIPLLVVPRKAK